MCFLCLLHYYFHHRVLKVFLSRTAQRIPYMTSWRVLRLLAIILLIVCWFLVAWTAAVCQNPDRKLALIDVGHTPNDRQFSMCLLDRWDYMMAVGEHRACPLHTQGAVKRIKNISLCVCVLWENRGCLMDWWHKVRKLFIWHCSSGHWKCVGTSSMYIWILISRDATFWDAFLDKRAAGGSKWTKATVLGGSGIFLCSLLLACQLTSCVKEKVLFDIQANRWTPSWATVLFDWILRTLFIRK